MQQAPLIKKVLLIEIYVHLNRELERTITKASHRWAGSMRINSAIFQTGTLKPER